jgi:hypothetical protein
MLAALQRGYGLLCHIWAPAPPPSPCLLQRRCTTSPPNSPLSQVAPASLGAASPHASPHALSPPLIRQAWPHFCKRSPHSVRRVGAGGVLGRGGGKGWCEQGRTTQEQDEAKARAARDQGRDPRSHLVGGRRCGSSLSSSLSSSASGSPRQRQQHQHCHLDNMNLHCVALSYNQPQRSRSRTTKHLFHC